MNFRIFMTALITTTVVSWGLGAIVLFCIGWILTFFHYLFDYNLYDPLIDSIYSLPVFFRHISLCLFSLIYILFEFLIFKKSRFLDYLNKLWNNKLK